MLAFDALILALPTMERSVHQFIRERKVPFLYQRGEMYLFRGILHSSWGSSLCRLIFSSALLLMVSSPFAPPRGVGNFGAFYLGCVDSLPLP
jgi:hypothetical protein